MFYDIERGVADREGGEEKGEMWYIDHEIIHGQDRKEGDREGRYSTENIPYTYNYEKKKKNFQNSKAS